MPKLHGDVKRQASPTELTSSPKRMKSNEASISSTLHRSELDYAMTLASLALNSPKSVTQGSEGLSPTAAKHDHFKPDAAPVTPVSPTNKRKRVHFSSEVQKKSVQAVGQTTSRLIRRRRPMLVPPPRPLVFAPYRPMHACRPHLPPPPAYRHHMMFSPWIPRQPLYARFPPPTPLSPARPVNTWICDYCNAAAFASYHEACSHEQQCKNRTLAQVQSRQPEEKNSEDNDDEIAERDEVVSTVWKSGCIALAIDATDREWLSQVNCFIRKHCIEAFSATDHDVVKTSKRGRIAPGQVGIRCKFCAHRPLSEKAVAAVSYPASLAGIYESVKRWQRVHLPACLDVEDATQAILDKLQTNQVWVPTTRQYWTDSARALGMVDTLDGIRFEREPSAPQGNWMPETKGVESPTVECPPSVTDSKSVVNWDSQKVGLQQPEESSGGYICLPEDQDEIPPYVYFLLRQVEPCFFTEADRFVARSKGPVGFAGFQCRHCQGHAGLGKYFPLNRKALSTNSTSQNIHAHVLKCRKCPQSIKDELTTLKSEKQKSARLAAGWRKTFFERLWERIHGDEDDFND